MALYGKGVIPIHAISARNMDSVIVGSYLLLNHSVNDSVKSEV